MAGNDDPLDKLAKSIKERRPTPKVTKATRTHALQEPNYTTLQRYCRSKGMTVSEILDSLIAAFLDKVADDLPPDLDPPQDEDD